MLRTAARLFPASRALASGLAARGPSTVFTRSVTGAPADGVRVTLCGGGNAIHVAAGMYSRMGADVSIFLSFEDEAKRFREGHEANGGMTVKMANEEYTARILGNISHKAEEVIPGSDMILIITPAFAHEPILNEIKPYLDQNAAVGAVPGPGGFDLMAKHLLAGRDDILIYGGSSLPWACRTKGYGHSVELLGAKTVVPMTSAGNRTLEAEVGRKLNAMHIGTAFEFADLFMSTTLWPTNCIIHTGILYGIWHDWDGKPVPEAPLFYQNTNEFTGGILDGLSNEIQLIKEAIRAAGYPLQGPPPIFDYIKEAYAHEIQDKTDTASCFRSNRAFRGLTCAVSEVDGGVVPNFMTRYLTEDVPHGIAVLRGIGEVLNLETPYMDKVLLWAQEKIEEEYLVDGKIQGKDVAKSGCPQRWGITDVKGLME